MKENLGQDFKNNKREEALDYKHITIKDIQARKGGTPIVCLTAYTASMASWLDPHCDLLLVGDSVGTVLYGFDNTLSVDLEMMIRHGQAVMRRAKQACVVVDLPYGTYEDSAEQAYESAKRVMVETGCDAVKLEGGVNLADTIAYLVGRDIPVMGHIGLMPQSVEKEGGYKIKGKSEEGAQQLLADAKAVAAAGAFSIVLEGTVVDVSEDITKAVDVPIIGIGASPACDGQVLVIDDMLGLHQDHIPKFVKQYASLGQEIEKAAKSYAEEVRARVFPAQEHVYKRAGQATERNVG